MVSIGKAVDITKGCISVARNWSWGTSISVSSWMGDHQERHGIANLCLFVGVDFNLIPTVYNSRYRADTDVNESNQTYVMTSAHIGSARLCDENSSVAQITIFPLLQWTALQQAGSIELPRSLDLQIQVPLACRRHAG